MKFIYKDTVRLPEGQINQTTAKLKEYNIYLNEVARKNNYEDPECTMNLPFDTEILQKAKDLVHKKVTPKLKYMIVIGIGGSNLGTKAIYDALFGFYDNLEANRFPKMIFLDTQDESVLIRLNSLLEKITNKEELLINAISKSGGTTETAANLEVVYELLKKKFGEVDDRIIFTTDEGSKMQQSAKDLGIDFLNIPKLVGGRFSVFSAVGLFPLAAIGLDIEQLLRGAQNIRDVSLRGPSDDNPAALSAAILYLSSQRGINIHDNFIFLPQLESLGKWYRQLMGESVGKDGHGITPTVSIGSTDLHSVGQLYLGGPKNKITTFVYGLHAQQTVAVPHQTVFNLVDTIPGKSIFTIMQAIVNGTSAAYQKQQLPYMSIGFENISEESLGEFLQFKMMEMMYLGKLFEVNTFDQPHVELYKSETKKILAG